MRIVHLIEEASPQGTPTTLAMIADAAGRLGEMTQHAALLGGSEMKAAARAVGLTDALSVPVPYGQAMLGWAGLRRRMQRQDLPRHPDLIHCWSAGAFTLAGLLFRNTPRVLTVATPPGPRMTHWLRVLCENAGAGPVAILPISSTLRRELLSGGVPEGLVHVLRPAIDMARLPMAQRRALRQGWLDAADAEAEGEAAAGGMERREDDWHTGSAVIAGDVAGRSAAEDAPVIALLSDPPMAADAMAAMLAVGLAAETLSGSRGQVRLLVHPAQFRRAKASQMMRKVNRPYTLVQESRMATPWEVLPGCDAALAIGPAAGGLALLWAMAGNVPIVGEATYAIAELVEDRHSALLSRPEQARSLAHNLCAVLTDAQLAWKLKDSARHEAYSYFSRQRYCQSLMTVYRQLAEGKPVEVPLMQSTGGLRFAGRG